MHINDFTVIVPFRGFNLSKTRLREALNDEMVSPVVFNMLVNTLQILDGLDPLLLTADNTLHGQRVIYDSGQDLNLAINQAISKINKKKIMLVMPDLPGLLREHIDKIMHLTKLHEYIIVPNDDGGTSIAILPKDIYRENLLGKNSSQKILEFANKNEIKIASYILSDIGTDLDTIDEWNIWLNKNSQLFNTSIRNFSEYVNEVYLKSNL